MVTITELVLLYRGAMLRIRDVYPGSEIQDPDFYPSRISDPTAATKGEGEKLVLLPFL